MLKGKCPLALDFWQDFLNRARLTFVIDCASMAHFEEKSLQKMPDF